MMPVLGDSDLATLETYVPRVVGDDGSAWKEFVAQLELLLLQLLRRSRSLGPLRRNLDDCRAVMINVLERLQKDDYCGLHLFVTSRAITCHRGWVSPSGHFGDQADE